MQDYKRHIFATLRIGYPVMISYAGYMLMNIIDSIMVGQVGKIPLAAASLGSSLFILFLVFGITFSSIVSPLVAITIGARTEKEAGSLFQHSLLVNVILGVLITSAVIISAGLIRYFDQPDAVVDPAVSYLRLLGLSVIPIMVFQSYKQFIEGLSITKPTMIAVLIANIVNAGANYIFIYGNFGFPALGLDGAGIATFISRLFMAAALVWYCLKKSELQIYRLYPRRFKPVKILIVRLLRLGIPAGFQSFFETSAFSISAILVGWIGTAQLAAHQIALSLASISFLIVLGISSAAAVRVGNEVGREDIEQTRKAGFSALFITVIIMTIAGCSFILFRSFLVSLFIDNPAVLVYAEKLLLIAAAFQIFDGIQATGMGILRGLTDVVMPSLLAIISYWLIGLPVSYIMAFVFDMGVEGVWYGFLAGLGIMSLLLLWRFNRQSRKIVSYHNDYYSA